MWVFIGLVITAAFIVTALWLHTRKIDLHWYEWLLACLGLVILMFALQNFFASSAEMEPVAPGRFLTVFGTPAFVILAVAFFLPLWRYFRSRKTRGSPVERSPLS